MSDSESENSIQSRYSDDELEHLGQPRASNESIKQPCTTVHVPSVELSKTSVTCATRGNIEYLLSLRSVHNQGNQGCHVTPEEAGSFKCGQFIETLNLTSPLSLRNTPPSLTPQRSWTMGRGRGRTRVEETKISTASMPYNSFGTLNFSDCGPCNMQCATKLCIQTASYKYISQVG